LIRFNNMKRRFRLRILHQMSPRRSNQGELEGWVCSTYGEQERCIEGLGRRLEGRRLLGRPRHRCEDNIQIDLQEVEWGGMEWICGVSGLGQDVGALESGNEPSGSIKCGEFLH
jgi:hypothetical protein